MKYFQTLVVASLLLTANSILAQNSTLRVSVSRSSSSGLWVNETDTEYKDSNGNEGKRVSNDFQISHFYVASEKSSIASWLTYSAAEMQDVPFGDVSANASRSGISEYGFKYSYQLSPLFSGGFGIRGAGDNRSGDTFIAINDGLTKYDLYGSFAKWFARFKVGFDLRYTYRPGELNKDQVLADLNFNYVFDKFMLAGSFGRFITFGGPDIGTPALTVSGSPAFSRTNEHFTAGSLGVVYFLKNSAVDVTIGKKLSGRNTDQNTSLTLGYSFDY